MILHIFNPEHDVALSYDNKYFTPPHAGRQLRYDLDYLPALWARMETVLWWGILPQQWFMRVDSWHMCNV